MRYYACIWTKKLLAVFQDPSGEMDIEDQDKDPFAICPNREWRP
jgi:hypothetical protein